MRISVIIPTKNEPLTNELVEEVHRSLKRYRHEIIVVDKSDERPKIKNAKLVIQKSDGLGKAVLEGLKHARGDAIVVMDADFSHDPKEIPKLLEKVGRYDIVIGSRFVRGGKNLDKKHRRVVSSIFRKLASFVLGLDVKDSMSGFSAIKKDVYKSLDLNPMGYKINLEILYKAKKRGFRIKEIPITFRQRREGKSKVGINSAGLKEIFRIITYTLKLRLGM